jgi:polysaccharide deacetylase family protein (PEP-CTERM system associated)
MELHGEKKTKVLPLFLFSIDLEDIRFRMISGDKYPSRLVQNTERYLQFLDDCKMKATFFTVGDVARAYPGLIKTIADAGHEIACHSDLHVPLDKLGKTGFREDTLRNVESLQEAGAGHVKGYRAPVFSLTEETSWAHEVLAELGFVYSSSVLPANSPLYGWKEFGTDPKKADNVWEIPMSVFSLPFITAPLAGGVYFRALPFGPVKRKIKKALCDGIPVRSYFHPYDIDTEQEHFMHPDIDDSRFYNFLLYYNRKNVFRRLDAIMETGCMIIPYMEYVNKELEKK